MSIYRVLAGVLDRRCFQVIIIEMNSNPGGKTHKFLGALVLFLVILNSGYGWTRTYGDGNDESGNYIHAISDDCYIITGWTTSFGGGDSDLLLLKLDSTSAPVWTKVYGGNWDDEGSAVLETADSGFVVVGKTASFGEGSWDVWILRTDSQGDTLWTRTYGGPNADVGVGIEIDETQIKVAANTSSFGSGGVDIWTLTLDMNGDTISTVTDGGEDDDWANSAFPIVGGTESYGNGQADLWSFAGEIIYGGEYWEEGADAVYADLGVAPPYHQGYVIVGKTNSYGHDELLIVGYSLNYKQILWTRSHGGADDDWANHILPVSARSHLILGTTRSYGAGDNDAWIVKINGDGYISWQKTYGGSGADEGLHFTAAGNQGCVISGYSTSEDNGDKDIWVLRLDAEGDTLPHEDWPDDPIDPDPPPDTSPAEWEIKNILGSYIEIEYAHWLNGFNAVVYNQLGAKVSEITGPATEGVILWGDDIPAGVYFIGVRDPERLVLTKVIILR